MRTGELSGDYRQGDDRLWQRLSAGREEILWYYESLVAAFREAGDHKALIDELDLTVRELRRLAASAP